MNVVPALRRLRLGLVPALVLAFGAWLHAAPQTEITGQPRFFQNEDAAIEGVADDDQPLYQAHYYGEFSVRVTGLAPGKYTLVLGNAELSLNALGARLFEVKINGQTVAAEVDLMRQFGFAKRADLTFTAEAPAGEILVELRRVNGRDFPRLSFLRVQDSADRTAIEWKALSARPPGWAKYQALNLDPATLDLTATEPPWPGTYKIRPQEKGRLTAADVPGPDGIVYPDFRYAGISGGIPHVPVAARIEDFGAKADDLLDDADALERGAAAVGKKGGGALLLGEGTYYLDRPVQIYANNVVLRGAGTGKTHLVFRYQPLDDGPKFVLSSPAEAMPGSGWIEAEAEPRGLQHLGIECDGREVAAQAEHSEAMEYAARLSGDALAKVLRPDGPTLLRAVATYKDGTRKAKEITVRLDTSTGGAPVGQPQYMGLGAISFLGPGYTGATIKLTRDAARGDTVLTLVANHGLTPGDRIWLQAPKTPRWDALVKNKCRWGIYRVGEYRVTAVEGNRVHLNQPVRLDFPIVDGSFVRKIVPVERCGVEDLSLEQTRPELWTNGIIFFNAWECWARGIEVKKAGRQPLMFTPAKFCEMRDCVFDDAWFKGGGGTAYIAWETAFDCLAENLRVSHLRHAPNVQWGASGNVFRNGVFDDADAQWHAGWANENLFENCTVNSRLGNGSYGFGMWASPPEDTSHGPEGPRNVVYHCDIHSSKPGIWMGGMNENWIIAYNRFTVGSGPAIVARTASFDHIIHGNVFVLPKPLVSAVFLATPDCKGIELSDNLIFGPTVPLVAGAAAAAVDQRNVFQPTSAAEPPRPQPAVPSIFEWQRQQLPMPTATKP